MVSVLRESLISVVTENPQNPEKSRTLTLQVIAAPSQLFFCRRIEIPEDVTEDEREGFVQLQLESMSPFPLEHLQFGYVVDESGRFAFLYSGYRRSFESGSIAEWEKQETVIPEFSIGAIAGKNDDGRPLLLVSENSVAYFEYDGQSELPCYFEAFPRERDENDQVMDLNASVDTAKARLGDRIKGKTIRVWNTNAVIYIGKQRLRLQAEENGSQITVIVSRETLWTMDLRDPNRIEHAKLEERRNRLIWKVALGMAAVFMLLILGEFAWIGSQAYVNLRKGWNEERTPAVALIESHQSTVFELEEFQDSDLKPFDMLIAVQPFMSDAVTFTKVETNGSSGLKAFGEATSQGQANSFKARLERSEKIDSVELRDPKGNAGGITFTALINFKTGAFNEAIEGEEVANNG
jgi:hypothetical protein|tara:strand:+ start:534 stop:1757 length:1224 start_codon:yes stop_codon:yes gene_type:complete